MSLSLNTEHTRDFFKGKSFRFMGELQKGVHYRCDDYIQDFVTYNNCLWACNKSVYITQEIPDLSTSDNWELVISGGEGSGSFSLNKATSSKLGGIKANDKESNQTLPVGIDSDGFLWVKESILKDLVTQSRDGLMSKEDKIKLDNLSQGQPINLQQATESTLGGIKAAEKGDKYTSEVKIDSTTGKLYSYNDASFVNGHTIETDVPSDAKFTDTLYDDTDIKLSIEEEKNRAIAAEDTFVTKRDNYDLVSTDNINKLSSIEENAQKNVIEKIKLNNSELEVIDKTVDLTDALSNKIDKDGNKVLSDVNFSTEDKNKLDSIEEGAQKNPDSLPANGGNSNTVNHHNVNSDVPENAIFINSDQEAKINIISTDGDGSKVLSDKGEYITVSSGGGGVISYNDLTSLPKINNVELKNLDEDGMSSSDLNIKGNTTEVGEEITVQLGNAKIGGFKTNDVIHSGAKLTDVIKKLLVQRISPTYSAPTLSLSSEPSNRRYEVGTKLNVTLKPSYNKKDGGEVSQYTLKRGSEILKQGNVLENYTVNDLSIIDNSITFAATVDYLEGPIKKDNLGDDSPDNRIKSGSISSNVIFSGYRKYFWNASVDDFPKNTSGDIRNFPNSNEITNDFIMRNNTGAMHFSFAIPSTKTVVSIVQKSVNLDIKNAFINNGITTINVCGDNELYPMEYNVYRYDALKGLNADEFKVTLK